MIIGIPSSIWAGVYYRNYEHGSYQQAVCIRELIWSKKQPVMGTYSKDQINLSDSGCPGPRYQEYLSTLEMLARNPPSFLDGFAEPFGIGILITGTLAVVFYATLWTLGWICAGFTRD
jgi:hypothetical protein